MENKLTREEYNKQRQYCPKCGSSQHMSTMMGFIWNNDKPEEYKNLNNCTCLLCDDEHKFHDRVSSPSQEAFHKIYADVDKIFGDEIFIVGKGHRTEQTTDQMLIKFNEYLEPFEEERNRGLLLTVLVCGKPFKHNPIVKDRLETIYQQLKRLRNEDKNS